MEAVTSILDDLAAIKRGDPHDARDVLADFPRQCRSAARLRPDPPVDVARPPLVIVSGVDIRAAVTCSVAALACTIALGAYFRARAGGITGDFLGATEQALECVMLVILAATRSASGAGA